MLVLMVVFLVETILSYSLWFVLSPLSNQAHVVTHELTPGLGVTSACKPLMFWAWASGHWGGPFCEDLAGVFRLLACMA